MRVLAVGNRYPPHGLGGYELVWQSAVRHLRGLGHEVRVLTTEHREPEAGAAADPDVHRELRWWWHDHDFPRLAPRAKLALERHNRSVLGRHLSELEPDVVSWWAMGGMSMSAIEGVRRLGIPAVAFVHDDWLAYGPEVDGWLALMRARPWLRPAAERLLGIPATVDLDSAARYVFVSETTRGRAAAEGRRPPDAGVAHSGIDPAFVDPRPERPWRGELLYVGRIDLRKGIATAVEALAYLPGARLRVIGSDDPAAERELRELAARAGVGERVEFAGAVAHAELPAVYERADAVLFPVLWDEPWGLVPLEAMGLGRPVVATGRGGSGEYLRDGENALLHEAGDAAALAAAVERLAADAGLRARLREGGLATARRHTADVFNAAVAEELSRACARGGSRGGPSSRGGRSAS